MGWQLASDDYNAKQKGAVSAYEIRSGLNTYVQKGYPNTRVRWRELNKNVIEVEHWLENNVKNRGVLGKPVSRLMARYQLRRKGTTYIKHGVHESWYWNGKPHERYEYDSSRTEKDRWGNDKELVLYFHKFDEEGRLLEYFNGRLDVNRPREAKFEYREGKRRVVKWRGRFHSKETDYSGEVIVIRNVNGKPLDDSKDYLIQKLHADGWVISEENQVAGQKHGFVRYFNKMGRVIGEEYWVRGTQVPEWVYLDPKGVTPEEIQAEEDEALREIILELQGTELYQVRAMARGMRAVARARLACEDAELRAELLAVRRPSLVEAKK